MFADTRAFRTRVVVIVVVVVDIVIIIVPVPVCGRVDEIEGEARGRAKGVGLNVWYRNDGMMVVSRASHIPRRRRGCARGRDGARSVTVSQPARASARRASRPGSGDGETRARGVAPRRALLQRARSADGG